MIPAVNAVYLEGVAARMIGLPPDSNVYKKRLQDCWRRKQGFNNPILIFAALDWSRGYEAASPISNFMDQ